MRRNAKWFSGFLLVVVVAVIVIMVTDRHRVRWEIVDESRTAEYTEILVKNGIPYEVETDHLGRTYIVTEGYSMEELAELRDGGNK